MSIIREDIFYNNAQLYTFAHSTLDFLAKLHVWRFVFQPFFMIFNTLPNVCVHLICYVLTKCDYLAKIFNSRRITTCFYQYFCYGFRNHIYHFILKTVWFSLFNIREMVFFPPDILVLKVRHCVVFNRLIKYQ